MKKLSSQEISEAFQVRPVLCWDEDGHGFVTVNFPIRQVRLLEEKFSGRLVTNPGAVRELHRAFVRFFKETKDGKPAEIPLIRLLNYWDIPTIETRDNDRETIKHYVHKYTCALVRAYSKIYKEKTYQ